MSSDGGGDGSGKASQDEFNPEEDLLRRYESMVQTQISTLNGIDDKAAYIARLVGVLAGLVLSAASIAVGTEQISLSTQTTPVFITLGAAVGAFLISLIYAIITYLSSKFEYGPTAEMGEYMSQYKVDEQQYKDVLLRGYVDAIKQNRKVVVTNAQRFEKCLASFLAGLLYLSAAGVVLVLQAPTWIEAIVILAFTALVVRATVYIIREEYLTLERRSTDNE